MLCAVIWGSSFVAQSVGMDYIGPFTFQCIRSVLAVTVLGIFLMIRRVASGEKQRITRADLMGGLACGTVLSCASWFQNAGLRTTSAGKAAFITALYIILVPFLSVVLKKKVPGKLFVCAFAALVGLYFLSFSGNELSQVDPGDLQCLVCSLFFATHIMLVDHFVKKTDGVLLSFLQFTASATFSLLPMLLAEHPTTSAVCDAGPSLLYSGIMSCGVAYTLQLVGQRYAEPAVATILMSLESVFSVLTGIIILRQFPSGREWIGCAILFAAVIGSELPEKGKDAYSLKDAVALGTMNLLSGGMSKAKSARQYEINEKSWGELRKKAQDPVGYIEHQKMLSGMRYGHAGKLAERLFFNGRRMDAADNTCEVIADYNVRVALGETPDFPKLLKCYSEDGICFGGKFGSNPKKIEEALQKSGYRTGHLSGRALFSGVLDTFAEGYDAWILTAYNRGHRLFSMIHTVAIVKKDEGYGIKNAGDDRVYESPAAAVRAFGGASIYLIGVGKGSETESRKS